MKYLLSTTFFFFFAILAINSQDLFADLDKWNESITVENSLIKFNIETTLLRADGENHSYETQFQIFDKQYIIESQGISVFADDKNYFLINHHLKTIDQLDIVETEDPVNAFQKYIEFLSNVDADKNIAFSKIDHIKKYSVNGLEELGIEHYEISFSELTNELLRIRIELKKVAEYGDVKYINLAFSDVNKVANPNFENPFVKVTGNQLIPQSDYHSYTIKTGTL